MSAQVLSIHVASRQGEETTEVPAAQLVAGKGITGDRNFRERGAAAERQLTLIEAEQIERFNGDHGRTVAPGAFRRNIVTRGIDLNRLVGQRFRVGEAVVEGMELCQPCATLGRILAGPGLDPARATREMLDRGGLRARIVSGAVVRPGDPVQVP